MPLISALRINMTGMSDDPAEESRRYRAAIDMAVHAEESGMDIVNLEEHHCADNGWLPSPLTLAAMIIGGKLKRAMPFGPFLAISTLLVVLCRPWIENVIAGLMGSATPINLP